MARRKPSRWRAISANGRLAALLGALVLVGTLAYGLTGAPFTVRQIEISGLAQDSVDELRAATGAAGQNIFALDPQAIAERLVARPTVRSAQVWFELPDRLVARVEERQPALVWQYGGQRYLVDRDGYVIAVDAPWEPAGLVVVEVQDGAPPSIGDNVNPVDVRTALTVAGRVAQGGTLPLSGMAYTAQRGLELLCGADCRIVFGTDARLEEKLAVALALMRVERGWTVLDLTDPDRPFYK